jgi:hypothetical protein
MRIRVALAFACVLAFGATTYANGETDQYGPYYPVLVNWDNTVADNWYKSIDSGTLAWAEMSARQHQPIQHTRWIQREQTSQTSREASTRLRRLRVIVSLFIAPSDSCEMLRIPLNNNV